jgi:hypothetical protein
MFVTRLTRHWLFRLLAVTVACSAASRVTAQELTFSLDNNGLSALRFGTENFLPQVAQGRLVSGEATLRRKDGTTYKIASDTPLSTKLNAKDSRVTLSYAWGEISCRYAADRVLEDGRFVARLRLALTISNSTPDTLVDPVISVLEPLFAAPVKGRTLEAGMFGTGGALHPLQEFPLFAGSDSTAPVVLMDDGQQTLALCAENSVAPLSVGVVHETDYGKHRQFLLQARFAFVPPQSKSNGEVSLRFGSAGDSFSTLANDVLTAYRRKVPFRVAWKDHRAIGALFLSSVGQGGAKNPRGWFNDKNADFISAVGQIEFRHRLLKYADESIAVLRDMNAQGMITWDAEGQQWPQTAYNGDPTQIETLAPETAILLNHQKAIDEYFARFRQAGFRVGVCIRPQELKEVNGAWQQTESRDVYQTLRRKIEYSKKRWGATLFYIDSTVDDKDKSPLPATVFEHLRRDFPDILMMPENETARYYASSAPLNSFADHNVSGTPQVVRELYTQAFSVLLAGDGDFKTYHNQLVESIRRGDILLFRGWWNDPNNATIKSIYQEARSQPAARRPLLQAP